MTDIPTGQLYRATMQTAVGTYMYADVQAETGDGAAKEALEIYPGAKVTHIEPAPAALQPHIIAALAEAPRAKAA